MTVSVCVPIYGVEKYIKRCAISLFEQTYEDIEYVFVDDCSPDRSLTILNELIENYPRRKKKTKIIRHTINRGLAAARNSAIENATGDFILHVDSDDYIERETVEKCLQKQISGDYDIVSFDFIQNRINYDRQIIQPNFTGGRDMTIKILRREANHGIWGQLIRRSLYLDNHISAIEGVNMAEDYYVLCQLSFFATRVTNLHEFLYHYNLTNENSYTNSFSREKSEQQLVVNRELSFFFEDKDKVCYDRLKIVYIRSVLHQLRDSLLAGDLEFYYLSIERLDKCERSLFRHIKTREKLPYFINNVFLNHCYLKMGRFIMRKYREHKYI